MKGIIIICSIMTCAIFACRKASKTNSVPQQATTAIGEYGAKKVIYYAEWDEWGRAARNCRSWGLCNFYDCWFCDPDTHAHKGKVEFDDVTKEGYLIITLDPSKTDELYAIQHQETFYVDSDINKTNSLLHAGVYSFDASIGSSGGYKIPITIK